MNTLQVKVSQAINVPGLVAAWAVASSTSAGRLIITFTLSESTCQSRMRGTTTSGKLVSSGKSTQVLTDIEIQPAIDDDSYSMMRRLPTMKCTWHRLPELPRLLLTPSGCVASTWLAVQNHASTQQNTDVVDALMTQRDVTAGRKSRNKLSDRGCRRRRLVVGD